MKNKIAINNPVINTEEYLTEEERIFLLEEIRKEFKGLKNEGIVDILFYNFLRKKPLFNGFEKMRNEKYYVLIYSGISQYNFPEYNRYKWYESLIKRFEKVDSSRRSKVNRIFIDLYSEIKKNFKSQ